MSRLLLHIGTHKTATTTIQHFLNRNRESLERRGVFYPSYAIIGAKPHYAHLGMVNALSHQHHLYSFENAMEFFNEVVRRSRNYDLTVISAEPFYRHADGEASPGQFSPARYWDNRNAYIRRMAGVFPSAEIVVVMRRQVEYVQSLYQEHVKKTAMSGDFLKYVKNSWFHLQYLEQVRAWSKEFSGVGVIPFEGIASGDNVAQDFCRMVGIEAEGLEPVAPQNVGLLQDMVILKRMLHTLGKSGEEAAELVEVLGRGVLRDVLRELPKRSYFESAAKMLEFQAQFDEENTMLGQYVIGGDGLPGNPFPKKFRTDVGFGDSLRAEVVAKLVEKALDSAD